LEKYNIHRSKVVILSKCYFPFVEDEPENKLDTQNFFDKSYANEGGLNRKHIFEAVDASLLRLGVDYIDVLQIHRLDRTTPKEEIMRALHDVVQSGKVRYIGASTMYAWEFAQLQHIAEKNGWTKFISMQNYHNLLYREEEREMIPFCKDTGVALIPWSPIARGALARSLVDLKSTNRAKTDFFMNRILYNNFSDVDKEIITRVESLAKKKGLAMAQVAIAWSISKGMIPIVGLSSEKRILEAVSATSVKLSEEDCKYLEEPYTARAIVGL